jgi:hypothetical protein
VQWLGHQFNLRRQPFNLRQRLLHLFNLQWLLNLQWLRHQFNLRRHLFNLQRQPLNL